MFSTLIERCSAFIRSVLSDGGPSPQGKRPSGGNHRGRRDAAPRQPGELGKRNSDFQGEAPSALLHAYREAIDDHGEETTRRRSFVI